MKRRSFKWTNPICNCLNCRHNLNNVCIREGASEYAGWKCPHFAPSDINSQPESHEQPGNGFS